jgi:putative oxidoreductase
MFFGHGLSKLTAGTARWEKLGHALTDLIGLDSFHIFFGFLASLSESIGALLVAFGLVTRFSSFFLFFTMAIASLKHLLKDDFSELALIYASICLVIMISGSGKYSLDYYLFKKND